MRKIIQSALIAGGLVAAAMPATAHHSFAMFDMQNSAKYNAVVTEFKWTNPHAFMHVEIMEKGKPVAWAIEMTSPNNLLNAGWRRSSLKPGDKVAIEIHPLRNGRKGGALVQVTLPDGKVLKNS